jgi:hypothetical protein
MTQKVHPSFDRVVRNRELTQALRSGGNTDGFVTRPGTRLVEDSEGDLPTGPLGTFDQTSSASSLSVTIGPGEALVGGAYLATDESFSVTLPASTTTTVLLAIKDGLPDTILVDEVSNLDPDDPRTALFDFTTDSAGVVNVVDRRQIGPLVQDRFFQDQTLIPEGETRTVREGRAVNIGGGLEVNGSLVVDGALVASGPITGTGSITGTGQVGSDGTFSN